MKLKVFFVLFLVIFSYVGFILGQYYAIDKLKQSDSEVNALNKFSLYENFKDISVYLKNNNIKSAKCFADLQASNYFDDTKICLASRACSNYITQIVRDEAPTLISGKDLDFIYYPIRNGKRECTNETEK